MTADSFNSEQLARQAGLNATATILSIFAFLKEREIAGSDWVKFIGQTFAVSWEPIRGQGAKQAMELVALDMCSIGARLISLSADEQDQQAEAVFGGWPDVALLRPFNLTLLESLSFLEIFSFLAAHINLNFKAAFIEDGEANQPPLIKAQIWPKAANE